MVSSPARRAFYGFAVLNDGFNAGVQSILRICCTQRWFHRRRAEHFTDLLYSTMVSSPACRALFDEFAVLNDGFIAGVQCSFRRICCTQRWFHRRRAEHFTDLLYSTMVSSPACSAFYGFAVLNDGFIAGAQRILRICCTHWRESRPWVNSTLVLIWYCCVTRVDGKLSRGLGRIFHIIFAV